MNRSSTTADSDLRARADTCATLLAKSGLFSDDEIRAIQGWWQALRADHEEMTAFLARHGMFQRESAQDVQALARGTGSVSSIIHLFAPHGIESLRRAARDFRLLEIRGGKPATDVTMTDSAHSDTVREKLRQDAAPEGRAGALEPPATMPISKFPVFRARQSARSLMLHSSELLNGLKLGQYQLVNHIGRGSKGLVFEAEDVVLKRRVAVKILAPEMASRGDAWTERFVQEARLASKIDHPLILNVLTVGEDLGLVFFAMPLMKNGSTRDLLRANGPFSILEATRIARIAARALSIAHNQGLSHGNLKPSNVFVGDDNEVKISDFSVPHLPLERTQGELRAEDIATDVRLLGSTYHWLLTGKPPSFGSQNVRDEGKVIPEVCARIISGAMARRRTPVYKTAADLEAALAEAQEYLRTGAKSAARKDDAVSLSDLILLPANAGSKTVEVGHVLGGKYLLTERIGQGSSGLVFRARHQTLNIEVAVKVLHINGETQVYRQLKSEACLLAQLNHPHIVRVWDFEDDLAMPYLVMEYVEGKNLGELIQQHGRMRPDGAVQVIAQIASGLAAAQQFGIVHRDVKPGNVLLTKDGIIKLADLGLAVFVDGERGLRPAGQGLAGTVAYMPPEQAMSAATVDHRSDIYALGASFYHLITAQIPFQGATRMEVILKHAKEALVPPHELVPDLPREISDVIVKMMAKKVADRYQTYDELIEVLQDLGERLAQAAENAETPGGTSEKNKSGRFTCSNLFSDRRKE